MTTQRSPHLILLLVAVLFVAPISACGGDDEGSDQTTTVTLQTTTSQPTTSSTEPTTTESTTTTTTTTTELSTTTTTAATATTGSTTTTTSGTSSSSTTAATRVVEVYFSTGDGTDCSEVSSYERTVDASLGPALAAFQELVGGPTAAEEAAGASSFFSSATEDAIRSVSLVGGVLTVDFEDIQAEISNAGTSCGSAAFTSSLNDTAFQFPTVDKVRYLFVGSCEDFGGFIQTDVCEFDRNG